LKRGLVSNSIKNCLDDCGSYFVQRRAHATKKLLSGRLWQSPRVVAQLKPTFLIPQRQTTLELLYPFFPRRPTGHGGPRSERLLLSLLLRRSDAWEAAPHQAAISFMSAGSSSPVPVCLDTGHMRNLWSAAALDLGAGCALQPREQRL